MRPLSGALIVGIFHVELGALGRGLARRGHWPAPKRIRGGDRPASATGWLPLVARRLGALDTAPRQRFRADLVASSAAFGLR